MFYLINPFVLSKPLMDVIIWYGHGLKLVFVKPRPNLVATLLNPNGWALKSEKT
jgi:hypothetical protein